MDFEVEPKMVQPVRSWRGPEQLGSMGLMVTDEGIMSKGLELLTGAKKAEMEKKWKVLKVQELEHFVRKIELLKEQAEVVLDAVTSGSFGLGFHRIFASDGSLIGFGHMGLGGATGYCDIKNRFAIGVTLNKCSSGGLTGEIIRFICSELHLPLPHKYAVSSDNTKPVFN
nr:protein kinase-like domain, beta-lactamase/transpeptidase-like protein [Tanacetum cinerariifolium]